MSRYFFNAPVQVPQGSNLALENASGNKLYFDSNSSMSSSYNLVFPSADGTSGQALTTDGSGNLSFTTVSGGSIASNAVINSTSGDIVFTTDSGTATLGADATRVTTLNGSNVNVVSTEQSTSTSTGSMVLDGGAGIAKDLFVGGNVNVAAAATLQTTLDVTGITNLNDTTQSSSTSTGALIVDGGVGVAKNLYVGGNVNVTDNVVISGDLTVNGTTTTINSNVTTIDDPVIQLGLAGVADTFDRGIRGEYNDGSDKSLFFGWDRSENRFTFIPDATYSSSNIATGTAGNAYFGVITAADTTQSTSVSTGALIVDGGVGVDKNLYVGGNVNVADTVTLQSTLDVTGITNLNDTTQSSSTSTGALIVDGGVGVAKNLYVGGNVNVADTVTFQSTLDVTGITNLNDTTQSTSTSTGALIVDGGVGVAKDAFIGGNVNVAAAATLQTTLDVTGITNLNDTTQASSTSTGALIVDGGVGVAKNLYVGGNVNVADTVTFQSTLDVTGVTNLNDTTQATSTSTGALIVDGGVGIAKNTHVGGTLDVTGATTLSGQTNVNNKMVVSVDEFDSSVGSTTDIWNGSNASTNKHILANATGLSNYSSSGSYTTGQLMNLFFTNNSGGSVSANIDFGANSLYSGTGTARYLLFNSTGQSASLIYIDASGSNDGWRIINTGAQVF